MPVYAIYLGADQPSSKKLTLTAIGNYIEGDQESGENFYPFVVRGGGDNNVIIQSNHAKCDEITNFIDSDDQGTGAIDLYVRDNVFEADEVTSQYVVVSEENLKNFDFVNNTIIDNSAYGSAEVIVYTAGSPPAGASTSTRDISGNKLRATSASSLTRFFNTDANVSERDNYLNGARFVPNPEYTISAGGVITIGDHEYITVDTKDNDATDDLDTITAGAYNRQRVLLQAASSARTVVVKHGAGNILLVGAADFSLTHGSDVIELIWNAGNTTGAHISQSDNET